MSSYHRPSALAVRVAAERRQRAIMAMLRDEHSERTDDLDERFRDLNARGMVVTAATAQKMVAARKGAAETKGAENDDDEQKQNGTQKPTPTTTDYDQLYCGLLLLPQPAAKVRRLSATTAAQNHHGTQIEANKGHSSVPKFPCDAAPLLSHPPIVVASPPHNAIEMLEPCFDEQFNRNISTTKNNDSNAMRAREKIWKKRAKNERRGALKQLRKVARAKASAYAERQREVRRERDQKTKRILQSLEVQESEHKKLKALKK
ncbi:hypothetical protein niasHT_016093 [Heterodera trifolii]|uniref:Uncharacterized protein n=1 Tax=Heterodera trifolii TaxID=157864 RepID=A0ABD2L8Q5_9BILA